MPYQSSDYESPFKLSQKKKHAELNQPAPADDATPQAELPTAEPAETAIAAALPNQEETVTADAPAKKKAGRPKKTVAETASPTPSVPAKSEKKKRLASAVIPLGDMLDNIKARILTIPKENRPSQEAYLRRHIINGHWAEFKCSQCSKTFSTTADEDGNVDMPIRCPYCPSTKVKKLW